MNKSLMQDYQDNIYPYLHTLRQLQRKKSIEVFYEPSEIKLEYSQIATFIEDDGKKHFVWIPF